MSNSQHVIDLLPQEYELDNCKFLEKAELYDSSVLPTSSLFVFCMQTCVLVCELFVTVTELATLGALGSTVV